MKKEVKMFIKMVVLYILLPFLLFLIHPSYLNNLPSICIYKNFFGIECPGCGITRAVLYLLHFRFTEALACNKLIILVFPLLIFIFIRNLIADTKHYRSNR